MFNAKFWLQLNPELTYSFINTLFVVALAFLAVAFFANIKRKDKTIFRKAWAKSFVFSITNFFVFLLWWVFAFEAVPLLSARIWFLLIGLVDIVWLFRIRKSFVVQPKSPDTEKNKINKRYIP